MPVSRAFLYISLGVSSNGALSHVPLTELPHSERDAPFPEPSFICLSEFPVNKLRSRYPTGAPMREMPIFRAFFYTSPGVPNKQGLLIKQNLTSSPSPRERSPPPGLWSPNGAPMERNAWLPESPVKEPSHEIWGKHTWSPSPEPQVDKRPTYNGVQPGSPRGSFTTLLLLPSAMQPSAQYFPSWFE